MDDFIGATPFKQMRKYVEEVEYDYEADKVSGYYRNVTPTEAIVEENDELKEANKKLEAKVKRLNNMIKKLKDVKAKEKAETEEATEKALPGNRLEAVGDD